MTDILHLDGVVAGWNQPIIGPLDLRVARGEVVGLCGPNGIGKSTVLSAIRGSARCFQGQVVVAPGCRIAEQTQQHPSLLGVPISGRELLAVAKSDLQGLPDWLAEQLDQRVDQLSGGQRQYLALWAVLGSPADLILLDEPSNNLDTAGIAHLATAIRARAARGAAILMISHEADLVQAVCDRSMTLEGSGYVSVT